MRTPIVAGRDFTAQDQHGPRVAIVNQVFARHYFGDTPAIGRRFTFEGRPDTYEIVDGLMAFMVTRRTSEIAVRMALGATRRNTLRMVIGAALRLAAAGLLVGIPLSFWSGRVAGRFMQLTGGFAAPLAVSIAVSIAVVALAAYPPARRADACFAAGLRPSDFHLKVEATN